MFEIKINSAPQWYECEPNWSWRPPPLPDCDLWYVARGRGEMKLQGQRFTLEPGRCFVVAPRSTPHAQQESAHRLRVFAVHFSWLRDEEGPQVLGARPPLSWMVRDREGFERLALTAESCWSGGELERLEVLRAVGAVQMMLWQGASESRAPLEEPNDAPLRELAALLCREPWRRMSLDAMAAQVHLSRSQLARRFRQLTGQSPNDYAVSARLERASSLLREARMSSSQVARALGYESEAFFARQFKQKRGRTPGEERNPR